MKENKLNFINDYLLLDPINSKNFVTVNNLLPYKKELIILPNNTLNLYTALVKRRDFTFRKLVGAIPFFLMKTEDITEFLPSSYKSNFYWKLRKTFSFYNNRKRIGRVESFRLWFEKESFPATLVRIIANVASSNKHEELELLSKSIQRIQFIDNFRSKGKLYIPKNFNELKNAKLAYLIGCAAGDGGFSLDDYWSIVDGDMEDIKSSIKHLNNVKNIIGNIFGLKFTDKCPRTRGNKCELWVANKWFGRFINFFFGLPYGKKKNKIQKSKILDIINDDNLTKMFWRGCFDTDGSCSKIGNSVSFSSGTRSFLLECKSDLSKFDIESRTFKSSPRDLRINPFYFKNFMQEIGFSHPRKMGIAIEKVKYDSYMSTCSGINKENLIENKYFDLRKIKGIRVCNLGNIIKQFRDKNNLRQIDFAELFGFTKSQVETWERNEKSIPLELISKLWLKETKDIKSLFQSLSKQDIEWKVGMRGKKECYVNLPIFKDSNVEEIAKTVRPYYPTELRIQKDGWKLISKINNLFNINVSKEKSKYYIKNFTIVEFFNTFFNYMPYWNAASKIEIENLQNKLMSIS